MFQAIATVMLLPNVDLIAPDGPRVTEKLQELKGRPLFVATKTNPSGGRQRIVAGKLGEILANRIKLFPEPRLASVHPDAPLFRLPDVEMICLQENQSHDFEVGEIKEIYVYKDPLDS